MSTALKTIVAILLICCMPQLAWAYVDPGTGSYIIQMIIATLVGGLFALKLFWVRIKTFLATVFKKKKVGDNAEE